MYKNTRVLVTGGAGFLGSQLVRHLLSADVKEIIVLDDLFTGKLESVPTGHNITFVHGSVTDRSLVRNLLGEIDYVFHFAARNMLLSVNYPESDFMVNTYGSLQLLLNLLSEHKHLKRFVYASTSSIYGNSTRLPLQEEGHHVSTPYAASKFAAELLALAYGESFDIPVTALRFSNVYGPGQVSSNPYCGVVSKFMQAVVDKKPLMIYDDGEQSRDFTYVDDAISAALVAGSSDKTLGKVMNVGTGVETTVNQLAKAVLRTTQEPEYPVEYHAKRTVDTVRRRVMDTSRLQSLTGWTPACSLDEGLSRTWRWFTAAKKQGQEASP